MAITAAVIVDATLIPIVAIVPSAAHLAVVMPAPVTTPTHV